MFFDQHKYSRNLNNAEYYNQLAKLNIIKITQTKSPHI